MSENTSDNSDNRELWACDSCGGVCYWDGKPDWCSTCNGKRKGAGGMRVHPGELITFSKVE